MTDPRNDSELMDAVNAGDEQAFASLYYRHRDWVVRLGRRFTGDDADALDVLQETFAYLLRKVPNLELTARMTTFLYPVVRNLSLQLRRKRRRAESDEAALEALAAPEAATDSELATVLASLSAAQREVLLMRFVDDFSIDEIAAALGIPAGTVKSRIHNAIKELRADERTRRYFGMGE